MRVYKKGTGILACFLLMLICVAFTGIPVSASTQNDETKEKKDMTIVFTHDLHSHLDSFMTELNGEEQEVGGFARLKTLIDETKAEDGDILVLDGGDFSMGTLYQTVFETQAAELRMLGFLGVDVTTLGNHEFDYRTAGLTNMLNTAVESGDVLPAMVLCNVDWEATMAKASEKAAASQDASAEEGIAALKEAFDRYGIADYVMLEKDGIRIAVTGVFGKDALECAPTCELVFRDPVKAMKETAAQIAEKEDPDMIVCVSHSGTWEEKDKSEDEILAKEVPQLDLIISGHTHSTLEEPIIHGDTVIVSTGEYGVRAGKIRLSRKENGRWEPADYQLTDMTVQIAENEDARNKIQELGATIDSEYLWQFGYTRNQVLAYNPWKNSTLQEMQGKLAENPFTNLLADSYLDTVNRIPEFAGEPAEVAIVPSGVIRDVFAAQREITVSDVFNVFSLGIGPDGVPGYPLVNIYLTGKELKTAAEVDASISPMMNTAQLYISGLTYTLNPNRLILNKVTDVSLCDMEGNTEELEDDRLYRVVSDLYSGQMLGAVSDQSFGILSIVPKDAQGNPVENLEEYIIYDNGQEVKAWEAVARYVERQGTGLENGEISDYYSENQERKIVEDNRSLGAILKNPNKIAMAMAGIAAAVTALLVLLVVLAVKLVKRRRRRKKAGKA